MRKRHDALLAHQLAHDHRGQQPRVDVAARENRARPCGRDSAPAAPAPPRGSRRRRPRPRSSRHSAAARCRAPDRSRRPARCRCTSARTTSRVSMPGGLHRDALGDGVALADGLFAPAAPPASTDSSSVCTPMISMPGDSALAATRDAGDQAAAADRHHQHLAGPAPPPASPARSCPAPPSRAASSYGCTNVSPRAVMICCACSKASLQACRRAAPPRRRASACARPSRTACDAASRSWPECPDDARDRPRPGRDCRPTWCIRRARRSAAVSCSSRLSAPRSLNEAVNCRFSNLM